jgi:hypothetical protein
VYDSNEQLRQARERIPSRRTPGECLSRQEVAELINEWLYDRTKKRVELDANYIGKLERGVIRWPGRQYREAFRAVLRAESDAQLGFHGHRRRSATVTDVDRQQFIRTAGTVMALPWLELFTPTTPTPVPTRVTPVEIAQVRTAARVFSSWDYEHGGGLAREAVLAQLRWSSQLLHGTCEERLRPTLFEAVAELGEVAGFMAFDACAHGDGRRIFRFALACAEHAENWHMRANVLADMARQAVWINDPDSGLTYVELALVRSERLTATERAMLHTVRARALAKLGRLQATLAAVGTADEAFAHANPAIDPPWMAFYDHAQHHGDTGHALFDLSVRGHRTQAAQRLAYSVAHHGDAYARSRAISRTKLATLVMTTGDPRRAAVIGQKALESAGSLRSRRAVDDLWQLHDAAGRHPAVTEARELSDRIAETLATR